MYTKPLIDPINSASSVYYFPLKTAHVRQLAVKRQYTTKWNKFSLPFACFIHSYQRLFYCSRAKEKKIAFNKKKAFSSLNEKPCELLWDLLLSFIIPYSSHSFFAWTKRETLSSSTRIKVQVDFNKRKSQHDGRKKENIAMNEIRTRYEWIFSNSVTQENCHML
jgi:hypothetical protein